MKKYQVFISSTYKDLKEERLEVIKTILECDCIPAGMEAFVSNSDEQFDVIKSVIDLCDYYVLIIGQRYGSINHKTGKSYTEMEFEYAVSKDIPVLAFVAEDAISNETVEHYSELKSFIDNVTSKRMVSFWKNKDDLCKKISISLLKSIKDNKRPGWLGGSDVDNFYSTIDNLKNDNSKLKNEIADLKNQLETIKIENEQFKQVDVDLLFDEKDILIPCKRFRGSETVQVRANLKDIFKYVSIQMIDVSVRETLFVDYLNESLGVYEIDKMFAKRICNQFIALNLVYTKWVNDKGLFYYLTSKGKKMRNELNLFVKTN